MIARGSATKVPRAPCDRSRTSSSARANIATIFGAPLPPLATGWAWEGNHANPHNNHRSRPAPRGVRSGIGTDDLGGKTGDASLATRHALEVLGVLGILGRRQGVRHRR